MKGFELASNAIILIVICIIIAATMISYIMLQSYQQERKTKAEMVFNELCTEYSSAGCDWKLTKSESFDAFYNACKTMYGENEGKYTCLNRYCCQMKQPVPCDAQCGICAGIEKMGLSTSECCSDYKNTCADMCSTCSAGV
ncbi:MAG: hypothetical protein V1802_01090 [Candidatus Aenigmatarchaeota archaeon]